MTKKLLFIASLPSKKMNFDGERNKSKDVLFCLKKMGYKIDTINYTKNKYLQTIKLILKSIFVKYDLIFISKCVRGGSIALHQILRFGRSFNKNNIFFYLIGNGFAGFENSKIYKDDMKKCRRVIVESISVQKSLEEDGINNCAIFPCIKQEYHLDTFLKDYDNDEPLKAIFFSRIVKEKGVLDAIEAIRIVNSNGVKYILDIAGGYPSDDNTHEIVEELSKKYGYINYYGNKFMIENIDSYKRLQQYDIHIFPTHFIQECLPGSVVDMFIAGVPTLSSLFPNARNFMNDENSFFHRFNDIDDLVMALKHISNNKKDLNQKRINSSKEASKYFPDAFIGFLEQIFIKDDN